MTHWIAVAQQHSEHVYRTLRLSMKLGFAAIILFIHAVFPFLFSNASNELLGEIHMRSQYLRDTEDLPVTASTAATTADAAATAIETVRLLS